MKSARMIQFWAGCLSKLPAYSIASPGPIWVVSVWKCVVRSAMFPSASKDHRTGAIVLITRPMTFIAGTARSAPPKSTCGMIQTESMSVACCGVDTRAEVKSARASPTKPVSTRVRSKGPYRSKPPEGNRLVRRRIPTITRRRRVSKGARIAIFDRTYGTMPRFTSRSRRKIANSFTISCTPNSSPKMKALNAIRNRICRGATELAFGLKAPEWKSASARTLKRIGGMTSEGRSLGL